MKPLYTLVDKNSENSPVTVRFTEVLTERAEDLLKHSLAIAGAFNQEDRSMVPRDALHVFEAKTGIVGRESGEDGTGTVIEY